VAAVSDRELARCSEHSCLHDSKVAKAFSDELQPCVILAHCPVSLSK